MTGPIRTPETAASHSSTGNKSPVVLRWVSGIATLTAIGIAVGPSSNSTLANAVGVPSLQKEIISPAQELATPSILPPIEIPVPEPSTPQASKSMAKPNQIEVTAADIPFGTPYSYVLTAKALGGTQPKVDLRQMTCPQNCDDQVINHTLYKNPNPPDYSHVYSFKWPQMGLNQGNINLAHASEIPGNVLAGQYFALLANGDRLSQTNIGFVTFKAGNKTVKVKEYIMRNYVETDSASSNKSSNQFVQRVARLQPDHQIMFATCGVPDDSKNEIRVFTQVGHDKLTPVDTKLFRSTLQALVKKAAA